MRQLSASEITNDALLKLKAMGSRVRRVNNVGAYRSRKNQVEPGWSDIQGYTSTGKALLVEVKTEGDTLKPAQKDRLLDLKKCGGISIIATQKQGYVELIEIGDYLIKEV